MAQHIFFVPNKIKMNMNKYDMSTFQLLQGKVKVNPLPPVDVVLLAKRRIVVNNLIIDQ